MKELGRRQSYEEVVSNDMQADLQSFAKPQQELCLRFLIRLLYITIGFILGVYIAVKFQISSEDSRLISERSVDVENFSNGEYSVETSTVRKIKDTPDPRTIYFYWDEGLPPYYFHKLCMEEWKRLNPTWTIRLYNITTASALFPEIQEHMMDVKVQHRSDYIRLSLLDEFGGVYTDVNVLPREPLDAWIDVELDRNDGVFMFKRRHDVNRRITSNWFIAAIPHNYLIHEWRNQLLEVFPELKPGYSYFISHHTLADMIYTDPQVRSIVNGLNQMSEDSENCRPNQHVWKRCATCPMWKDMIDEGMAWSMCGSKGRNTHCAKKLKELLFLPAECRQELERSGTYQYKFSSQNISESIFPREK